MKLKSNQPKDSAEQVVKNIRRATRRHYTTEDKIRIVLICIRGVRQHC
jgi:transposase